MYLNIIGYVFDGLMQYRHYIKSILIIHTKITPIFSIFNFMTQQFISKKKPKNRMEGYVL